MPAFVALLRGVNVGRANRVPMLELRRLLEDLGCTEVVTLLNSGNVVFRCPKTSSIKVAAQVAASIAARLNVTVPVIVKSSQEYSAVVDANPFADRAADHSRLLVAFTQNTSALASLTPLAALVQGAEEFVVGKYAAYVHFAGGILKSKLGAALLGKAGKSATTRNWATCLRLHELLKHRKP